MNSIYITSKSNLCILKSYIKFDYVYYQNLILEHFQLLPQKWYPLHAISNSLCYPAPDKL